MHRVYSCVIFVLPPGHVCISFWCYYVRSTRFRFGSSFRSGARFGVGYLCSLKLVLNSDDEDSPKLMSAVATTQ